ncbi:hypothetical protein DL767_011331 [Monosporascus sp. MG133]|nr:hypothetical protein DL767_011331 [Monosporascus sp. MG133]
MGHTGRLITAAYFKTFYVQAMPFAPVYFTSKAAIFLLYRQIFRVEERIRVAVNISLLITLLLHLPNLPLSAIYNAPPRRNPWEPMLRPTASQKMIIWGIIQSFITLMGIVASVLSLVYRIKLLHTTDQLWQQTIVAICAQVFLGQPPSSLARVHRVNTLSLPRLIVNNVAIIISCMPALAQILNLPVWRVRLLQVAAVTAPRHHLWWQQPLEGRVKGRETETSHLRLDPTASAPKLYELTDTAILESEVTVSNDRLEAPASPQDGIVCSVGISQHFGRDSMERSA